MTRQSGVDSTHTDLGVWQSRNMATVEMSTSDMFRSRVCCRIRRGLEEPAPDTVIYIQPGYRHVGQRQPGYRHVYIHVG